MPLCFDAERIKPRRILRDHADDLPPHRERKAQVTQHPRAADDERVRGRVWEPLLGKSHRVTLGTDRGARLTIAAMSILSTHLWGTRRTVTPLSPVGERVARMRQARMVLQWRWVIPAIAFGKFFWLFIASGVQEARLSVSLFPGPMVPGGPAVATRVAASPFDILVKTVSHVDWSVYVLFALMFAFFVWGLPRLVRWKFDRSAEARSREARDQRRSARRTQTIALIVGSVAVIAVLVMTAVAATSNARVAVMLLGFPLSVAGPGLIAVGLTQRHGARVVCGRCDYPMTTWRGAPMVCSECGNAWKQPWAALVGERRVRRGLVWCGVGLYGLAFVLPWVATG